MRNIIAACLWCLLLVAPASSQKREEPRFMPVLDFLRGLDGVSVRVTVRAGDESVDARLKGQLQTDVELRLRAAGIPVTARDYPSLDVTVFAHRPAESSNYAAFVEVSLKEYASLLRAPSLETAVSTWKRSGIYFTDSAGLGGLRDEIEEFVDAFAKDYRAANPKR